MKRSSSPDPHWNVSLQAFWDQCHLVFAARMRVAALLLVVSIFVSGAAAEGNKLVVEKDPTTGEITMRSIPSEATEPEKAASHKPVEKKETLPAARETHVSQNPVQDAFSGFWIIAAMLLLLVGVVWMLICMAQESIFWLIAGLLLNPVAIFVFLIVHRRRAAGPFFISLLGYLLLYIAYLERVP